MADSQRGSIRGKLVARLICNSNHLIKQSETRFVLPHGKSARSDQAMNDEKDMWIRSRFDQEDDPGNYAHSGVLPDWNPKGFTPTQIYLLNLKSTREGSVTTDSTEGSMTLSAKGSVAIDTEFGQTEHQTKLLNEFCRDHPQVWGTNDLR